MREIYLKGEYVIKNPTYHVEDSPWKAQQIFRMVNKHKLQPVTVCEIGCGAGEILRQLQQYFSKETLFHGYEISPQGYALCKQRENERLKFYCQDFLRIDTSPYDILLCIDVFEHVEDYMGFLKQLRQRATYKIFHIPLDMSVLKVLRGRPILDRRTEHGHLHYFNKDTALQTLKDTGYEIMDWFYTCTIDLDRARLPRIANIPIKMFSFINADLTVRIFGGHSLLVLAK